MKHFIAIFLPVVFSASSYAASKMEIVDLLRATRLALEDSTAESTELEEAAEHLTAALDILDSTQGSKKSNACLTFSIEQYKSSGNSPGTSVDKAAALCRTVIDVEVLKLGTEMFNASGYSSGTSIEKAAGRANAEVKGKVATITFATQMYRSSGNSAGTSFEKAVEFAKQVPKNSLECVQVATENYKASGYSPGTSIDKSIEVCK
jgi:hypothetical protein